MGNAVREDVVDHSECIYFLEMSENSCLLYGAESIDDILFSLNSREEDMGSISEEDIISDFDRFSAMTRSEKHRYISDNICPYWKDKDL